jgi:hypothetical protein
MNSQRFGINDPELDRAPNAGRQQRDVDRLDDEASGFEPIEVRRFNKLPPPPRAEAHVTPPHGAIPPQMSNLGAHVDIVVSSTRARLAMRALCACD